MRLFTLLQMKYSEYTNAVREFLSKTLSEKSIRYGNSTVYGQLLSVLGSTTQNIMSYIEDALTEQNKYTAQRRRSIYNLASLSGYKPSMGMTASATVSVTFKPTNEQFGNIIIDNHTVLNCSQNNLKYNIILQQQSIVLNQNTDTGFNNMEIVEGTFETQTFVSNGGKLYSQQVDVTNDTDINFMRVFVNDIEYHRVDSLYDMMPNEYGYLVNQSIKRGFILTFGNDVHGHALENKDTIRVEYLKHSGVQGNIDPLKDCEFTFADDLRNSDGDTFDGNEIFSISIYDQGGVTSGTNSDSVEDVRMMIGYNSRSLVLADTKNYDMLLSRFAFVGYNKTWSQPGSLVVNSMVIKNYNDSINKGRDYFQLKEKDFKLNSSQRRSIISHVTKSGSQLAGSVYNIVDPVLRKYAMYCFIKMKNVAYNKNFVENNVRDAVGTFFSNIKNDAFVPKSDVTKAILECDNTIDSVDVYFISERNEKAMMDGYYDKTTYDYNPGTESYTKQTETITVYQGEDPGIGLDEHGNILLEDEMEYPVLMDDWEYQPDPANDTKVKIIDPLIISIS